MRRWARCAIIFLFVLNIAACTATPDAPATGTRVAANNVLATQTAGVPRATNTLPPADTPAPTRTAAPANTVAPSATVPLSATTAPTARATNTATATPVPEVVVTSTLEAGWTQYEMQTSKFAIAVPDDWMRVDLSAPGVAEALAVAGEKNPGLQSLVSTQTLRTLVASGVKFFALDLAPEVLATGFPVSVNVIKVDLGAALSLDSLAMMTVEQMAKIGSLSTNKRVTLNGIPAEQIQYEIKGSTTSGGPIPVLMTQYLVIDGTAEYVISMGAPRDTVGKFTPVFDQIAASFRLLK